MLEHERRRRRSKRRTHLEFASVGGLGAYVATRSTRRETARCGGLLQAWLQWGRREGREGK